VRIARFEDIESIIKIQDSYCSDLKSQLRSGFIIHPIKKDELERGISGEKDIYIWVYDSRSKIKGYLIAYTKEGWLSRESFLMRAKVYGEESEKVLEGDFIYGRHIAKEQGVSRIVPIKLEEELFRQGIRNNSPCAIAEVALNPLNYYSVRFNVQDIGWEIIGTTHHHRVLWGLIYKSLESLRNEQKNKSRTIAEIINESDPFIPVL
jgi:hypothetical protein